MQNELLVIDKVSESIIYLGYPLKLTKREFTVLDLIIDHKDGISSRDLLAAISPKKNIGIGNIAVQVFNINKKAKEIGGRNIIVESRADGYMLVADL
jgi:DNA-binding response OmpR family regulator